MNAGTRALSERRVRQQLRITEGRVFYVVVALLTG